MFQRVVLVLDFQICAEKNFVNDQFVRTGEHSFWCAILVRLRKGRAFGPGGKVGKAAPPGFHLIEAGFLGVIRPVAGGMVELHRLGPMHLVADKSGGLVDQMNSFTKAIFEICLETFRDRDAIGHKNHDLFLASGFSVCARSSGGPATGDVLRVCMPRVPTLSKSRFTYGLQCHKQLWWRCFDGKSPELTPSPSQQAVFSRGHRVGDLAQEHIPGGFLIPYDGRQKKKAVTATAQALASGEKIIYEAAFEFADVFVAVDILIQGEQGWTMVEVKSSTSVKEQHIPDAAVQVWVARASGIPVTQVELMHLNRKCRFPDLSNLFSRTEITERVEAFLPRVSMELQAQKSMLDLPIPIRDAGAHCRIPYECPFLLRCQDPLPDGHVSELHGLGALGAQKFLDRGQNTLLDLQPNQLSGKAIWSRQREAAATGEVVCSTELIAVVPPDTGRVGYLDFETLAPAVPVWEGCGPYQNVPAQFSLHIREDGRLEHHEFLATGGEDPRPAVAEALVAALAGCTVLFAYNADFERRCLRQLAACVPDGSAVLLAMAERVEDFLPLVRNHVYHPDFQGSFSLKAVLPALVPEMNYGDLRVADGQLASAELETLLLRPDRWPQWRQRRTRQELLAYCARDTMALVGLHDWFLEPR